ELDDSFERGFRILDTPISHRSVSFVRCITAAGLQTEFVASHIETNVKRLVEIRLHAEQFAIPGFAFFDIVNMISRSAQAKKHIFLPPGAPKERRHLVGGSRASCPPPDPGR